MPATTWDDLGVRAFEEIAVIQPGESITTAMRDAARSRLQDVLSLLSTEGATVYTQKTYTTALQAGVSGYTVGAGGSMNTGERVQRVTAWDSRSGDVVRGGPVLSLDAFGAAMQAEAERIAGIAAQAALVGLAAFPATITAPVPSIVGADTAFPLINLRVFPTPSANSAIVLAGWTPLTAIADFTAALPTLPSGWEPMLKLQLALLLYPMFARQGGIPQELAANAMNAKASIVNQNTAGKPTEAK